MIPKREPVFGPHHAQARERPPRRSLAPWEPRKAGRAGLSGAAPSAQGRRFAPHARKRDPYRRAPFGREEACRSAACSKSKTAKLRRPVAAGAGAPFAASPADSRGGWSTGRRSTLRAAPHDAARPRAIAAARLPALHARQAHATRASPPAIWRRLPRLGVRASLTREPHGPCQVQRAPRRAPVVVPGRSSQAPRVRACEARPRAPHPVPHPRTPHESAPRRTR